MPAESIRDRGRDDLDANRSARILMHDQPNRAKRRGHWATCERHQESVTDESCDSAMPTALTAALSSTSGLSQRVAHVLPPATPS